MASSSSEISLTTKRMVNFVIVRLDSNLNESTAEFPNSLAQLRSIVNDVYIFRQEDEAIDFLTEISAMHAFLIVSGNIGEQILPLVHDIPQLDAIYIFTIDHYQYVQGTQPWIKVKGVYTDISHLCQALQVAVKQCEQNSIPISFLATSDGVFNGNLNQLEPLFMYTQLFKEILLEMENDQQSVRILADYCRGFYQDNTPELDVINEFEKSYRAESVVQWYTRNCFLYKMLNRALRTLEGDTIINMGFFIRDLHRRIQQLYSEQFKVSDGKPFTVYRGQGLSKIDFDKLMRTKGGLMSFNNFLSTSKKQEIAGKFAKNARSTGNMIGVLFRIAIDPSLLSTPYASIRDYSYYETEDEILFSMHTVFRISENTSIGTHDSFYQVDLKLTSDDDGELRILTQSIRGEILGTTGSDRLGKLLIQLNQLNVAEEVYHRLQQQKFDINDKALHYQQLASIKSGQGDYEKAIEYYEETLEIFQKTLPANHPSVAPCYGNMGMVYYHMGEYSKALSFYEKDLEICQKSLRANHPSLATCYGNMARVYRDMGEYSKALSFYEKTLEIFHKTLPSNHLLLATCYGNMAGVYEDMGEYSKALSFYEKTLEICQKTLPSNHPSFGTCYGNMGIVYSRMGEYSKALSLYEKDLEICQKTLPANHPSLATCYGNMAGVYRGMGEYSKALLLYEKNLEICQKTLPANHPSLATCYGNMAVLYDDMGEYSKALSFYEKDLEICHKTLPTNHVSFGFLFNNIAGLYYRMNNRALSLSYLEYARMILQHSLPEKHPYLEKIQKRIDNVQRM